MKKILTLALLAVLATGVNAKPKKAAKSNKPVFTVVKENPITSIKDQNRSGAGIIPLSRSLRLKFSRQQVRHTTFVRLS